MTFTQKFEELKQAAEEREVLEQVQEELGPFYTKDEEKMLNQKYGLIPPQYTASEKNLILLEERRERGL